MSKYSTSKTCKTIILQALINLVTCYSTISIAQANNGSAKGAIITNIQGNSRMSVIKGPSNTDNSTVTQDNKNYFLLNTRNQRLVIPPDPNVGAVLDFRLLSNNQRAGFIIAAGFNKYETKYYYDCTGAPGNFTIGWDKKESTSFKRQACRRFQIVGGKRFEVISSRYIDNLSLNTKSSKYFANNIFSGPEFDRYFLCSAIETLPRNSDIGDSWGISSSKQYWNIFSKQDPCHKSYEKCNAKSESKCFIDYSDERYADEKNLMSMLLCKDQFNSLTSVYRKNLTGKSLSSAISSMEEEAESKDLVKCQLTIAGPGEFTISPSDNTLTVANIHRRNESEIQITVLAGKVDINLPLCEQIFEQPVGTNTQTLDAGRRYILLSPQANSPSNSYKIASTNLKSNSANPLLSQQLTDSTCGTITPEPNPNFDNTILQNVYDSNSVQYFLENSPPQFRQAIQNQLNDFINP